MEFEELYQKVSGIVHKARKEYYIKLWDASDWEQEGMMVHHQLLQSSPEVAADDSKLYRYFKVKFRHYIVDMIRKQESEKRRFDRLAHEELSNVSHEVASPGLLTDELVVLRDRLRSYRSQLSPTEAHQYDRLLLGEQFRGRKALLRDLYEYLR